MITKETNNTVESYNNKSNIFLNISRYIIFWPYFLISIIFFLLISFTYLRYAEYIYSANAKIEIIDKAQDSEMSLPTSMTIFNRSMINLENEMGVLNSVSLHKKTIKFLKSNVRFYTIGNIKTSENFEDNWFDDFNLTYNIDTDTIANYLYFNLEYDDGNLKITQINDDNIVQSYSFKSLSTLGQNHDLPFDIEINSPNIPFKKSITFEPVDKTVKRVLKNFQAQQVGTESDQLSLVYFSNEKDLATSYLNRLIYEFDLDGIEDRRLEYKRTIEFVDNRADFLSIELEKIENTKRDFKRLNKLTDIKSDALINIDQQSIYNADLFKSKSQKDLVEILKNSIDNSSFEFLPVNIGIDESNINNLIISYNDIVKNRNRLLLTAGPNNKFILNLENQLSNFLVAINKSVDNYLLSLNQNIESIKNKEKEFVNIYKSIPEKEKILRSIERELEIKESLFLLLIQKREEAAINFAVIKPSLKIIDVASVSDAPIYPNKYVIYTAALILGVFLPSLFFYIRFYTDTKIHIKSQLEDLLNDGIPVIAEIPYINDDKELTTIASKLSVRSPILESVRMLLANFKFSLSLREHDKENDAISILVSSSVKGEGKTLVSTNISSVLSMTNKVLLIGSDLRNPQIHKILNKSKDDFKGITNIIYDNNIDNYKDYLIKEGDLDILLSGDIPPNPSEILSSSGYERLIKLVKKDYDYIIIDSAPCLLVSDTFEISKFVDYTFYIVRSNHTDSKLCEFINECSSQNKLNKINIVFNSVGKSTKYGYKYGYQYGYKYGYKYGYSYNYGYGYGYEEDKD